MSKRSKKLVEIEDGRSEDEIQREWSAQQRRRGHLQGIIWFFVFLAGTYITLMGLTLLPGYVRIYYSIGSFPNSAWVVVGVQMMLLPLLIFWEFMDGILGDLIEKLKRRSRKAGGSP